MSAHLHHQHPQQPQPSSSSSAPSGGAAAGGETGVPGDAKSMASELYEQSGAMLQSFDPIKQVCAHLAGLHFYGDDGGRTVRVHHYCSHVSQDMRQCLIYSSADKDARLIGVEYIISKKLFDTLDEEEKKMWHSHHYEVKSGTVFMPFISVVPQAVGDRVEHMEMQELANTYGKTWHLWQVDRGDMLPVGPAQLMMAFTEKMPPPPKEVQRVEKDFGVEIERKRKMRADIEYLPVDPAVNVWEKGVGLKSVVEECEFRKGGAATTMGSGQSESGGSMMTGTGLGKSKAKGKGKGEAGAGAEAEAEAEGEGEGEQDRMLFQGTMQGGRAANIQ